MRNRVFSVMLVVIGLVASSMFAQTADPRMGTWKLNLAKSKYNPGPPPKSQTLTYEPSEGGFKFTADGVAADGQPTHTETIAKLDGKDYPVSRPKGASPGATSRAYKRVNARTVEIQDKVNDAPSLKRTESISADGKTMTVTVAGPTLIGKGQMVNNLLVYDKQ